MNRIKGSLSMQIFLGTAFILLAVSLSMFGMLRVFMPKTYENKMAARVTANMQTLAGQLEAAPQTEWENVLMRFCLANNTGAAVFDENGEQAAGFHFSVYNVEDGAFAQTKSQTATWSFSTAFENSGKRWIAAAYVDVEAVDQIKSIFVGIFPPVFGSIVLISMLAAFLYSRFLAKPIVGISNVSKKMAGLDLSWRCAVSRSDEIGVLAANLNEMAVKLDSTMQELQAANERLKADIEREREQERRRRDFFSAISHELKTPITILKGELDGMILNVGKFRDRDQYLQEAYETTQSIEKLVREILMLAKLDTLSLLPEEVKLSSLMEDCLRIYQDLAQIKHIQMNSHYEEEQAVCVDKGQIRTVLSNLVGNAVKHSPKGSRVDISIAQKEGKMEVTVENSGIHIAPDELAKVFEPFYRTDKSRSRDTGGSGLGLYIVKTILDLHKLSYRFENTASGMLFQIRF